MTSFVRKIVSLFVAAVLTFGTAIVSATEEGVLQCVTYVARLIGISHYGDGKTWWTDPRFIASGYAKNYVPLVGSIVVFDGWGYADGNGDWHGNPYGHVGIVRQIISSSEILIDHANWDNKGTIYTGVGVRKANGSWSSVNVKKTPSSSYGSSSYPVLGFLVPPPSPGSVIGIVSPFFVNFCIKTSPADSRCSQTDIDFWWQCWGPPYAPSPICNFGMGGGDYVTPKPDLILYKAWLQDDAGNVKITFSPGEHIQMKGQAKNTGNGNSTAAVTVKFYRSNGEKVDTNKQQVGSDTIQASSLPSGSTHTETEGLYAPTTPGTYNIVVCIDTGNTVAEEHESNNCSKEAVFKVDDFSWLIPIINLILED